MLHPVNRNSADTDFGTVRQNNTQLLNIALIIPVHRCENVQVDLIRPLFQRTYLRRFEPISLVFDLNFKTDIVLRTIVKRQNVIFGCRRNFRYALVCEIEAMPRK